MSAPGCSPKSTRARRPTTRTRETSSDARGRPFRAVVTAAHHRTGFRAHPPAAPRRDARACRRSARPLTTARASVARSATRAYARDDDDGDDNSSRPRGRVRRRRRARRSGTAFSDSWGTPRARSRPRARARAPRDEVVVGRGARRARGFAHWVATCGMGGTTVPLNLRWGGREPHPRGNAQVPPSSRRDASARWTSPVGWGGRARGGGDVAGGG